MLKNTLFGKEVAKLNIIDGLLLCYVVVVIISLCIHPEGFNLFVLSKWAMCCLCYIVARRLQEKQYISWGIILIGVAESFWAVSQQLHWAESFHRTFEITGTFGNPGQLGIFMSLAITVAFGMYQTHAHRNKLLKYSLPVLILLFTYVLILSDSRAGWIAAVIGCGFIWYRQKRNIKLRLWMRCVLLIIGIILAIGTYYYKQNSANGRLLIWRISTDMITDAPLAGHGIESFPKGYMYYQARYFRKNPDSQYKILADNIIYPYNEFILIAVELGIMGLFIALAICIVMLLNAFQKENLILGGAFIAFVTFSMFSYPSHTFLLWIMIPFLLGGMNVRQEIVCKLPLKKFIVYGVYLVCLCFFSYGCYRYYTLDSYMKEFYRNPSKEKINESELYFNRHKKELAAFPHLLDIYAQYSFRYYPTAKSLDIMRFSAAIIPTSELWCDIGDLYVACNRMEEAIEAYKLSAEMIPCRVTPKYKLAMLYYKMGDVSSFRLVGEDVLDMEIKVESTKVLEMIAEIKLRLHELRH